MLLRRLPDYAARANHNEISRRVQMRFWLTLWLALLAPSHDWLPLPSISAQDCETSLPLSEERAEELLASERPLEPENRELFYSVVHSDWVDSRPPSYVDGPERSESEIGTELRAFLEARFPCDPQRVTDGLNIYTDPVARMKAPEPAMRAALATLVGTIGEPAIDHLMHRSPVTLIHFGVVVERGQALPARLGIAYDLPDGTRQIVLDRAFRFAPFASFAPLLFHEALHTGEDDDVAGLTEETIASALESIVYMQLLLADPSLALLPDELTRGSNNPMALARLNSGPIGSSELTLFVPGGREQIDPTWDEALTEFWAYYGTRNPPPDDPGFDNRETKGHQMLAEVLAMIAEPGVESPENPDFDAATASFVDLNQGALSAAELILVACILQLNLPCD